MRRGDQAERNMSSAPLFATSFSNLLGLKFLQEYAAELNTPTNIHTSFFILIEREFDTF